MTNEETEAHLIFQPFHRPMQPNLPPLLHHLVIYHEPRSSFPHPHQPLLRPRRHHPIHHLPEPIKLLARLPPLHLRPPQPRPLSPLLFSFSFSPLFSLLLLLKPPPHTLPTHERNEPGVQIPVVPHRIPHVVARPVERICSEVVVRRAPVDSRRAVADG